MSTPIKVVQAAPLQISRSEFDRLPESGFLRLSQLVLPPKSPRSSFAILPFSAATVWRKAAEGTFPSPFKLSAGVTAWMVGDVRHWLRDQAAVGYIRMCESALSKKAAKDSESVIRRTKDSDGANGKPN